MKGVKLKLTFSSQVSTLNGIKMWIKAIQTEGSSISENVTISKFDYVRPSQYIIIVKTLQRISWIIPIAYATSIIIFTNYILAHSNFCFPEKQSGNGTILIKLNGPDTSSDHSQRLKRTIILPDGFSHNRHHPIRDTKGHTLVNFFESG